MKKIMFYIGVVFTFSSCFTKARIAGNNKIYHLTDLGEMNYELQSVSDFNCYETTITEKDNYVTIKAAPTKSLTKDGTSEQVPTLGDDFRINTLEKFYFPESTDTDGKRRLKYYDSKLIFQGMSIPVKIRPKRDTKEYNDSIPGTTETGFNANLAFGLKHNMNYYKPNKNLFGSNTTRFSISYGIFMGTGAVDITGTSTRNPRVNIARKLPIASAGGFIMLGFNSFNVGYSLGWDHAIGEYADAWIYQGHMWHGITIGIDIVKL